MYCSASLCLCPAPEQGHKTIQLSNHPRARCLSGLYSLGASCARGGLITPSLSRATAGFFDLTGEEEASAGAKWLCLSRVKGTHIQSFSSSSLRVHLTATLTYIIFESLLIIRTQ